VKHNILISRASGGNGSGRIGATSDNKLSYDSVSLSWNAGRLDDHPHLPGIGGFLGPRARNAVLPSADELVGPGEDFLVMGWFAREPAGVMAQTASKT